MNDAVGDKVSQKSQPGLEQLPTLIAASTSALYVLGFLVATSYFVSKGIYDQTLVSPKYIMAGALMAVIFGAYYFFVWRKLVQRARDGIQWHSEIGPCFRAFLDTYYVVEFAYACCFVSAWIGGILISDFYALPIQLVISLAFVFDVVLIKTGLYQSRRRSSFVLSFIANSLAIVGFCIYAQFNPALLSLFSILVTFTFIGSIVIASPTWKSGEDKAYGIFYLVVSGIVGVVTFGATVYQHISPRFGGAEPIRVSVTLDPESNDGIQKEMASTGGHVYLILDTDSSITFRLGENPKTAKYLRLEKKLVRAMLFEPPPEKDSEATHLSKQIRKLLESS